MSVAIAAPVETEAYPKPDLPRQEPHGLRPATRVGPRPAEDDPIALAALERRLEAAVAPATEGALAGPRVSVACRAQIASGGSRVRARLALDAGHGLALDADRALAVATAVELLHNASLAHDDLADGDTTRRGAPALWCRDGPDIALLAGDLMISAAYATAAPLGLAALGPMHPAIAETAAGQAADREGLAGVADRAGYDAVAGAKSGPLIELPLVMVARLAGAGQRAETARAARRLALVYQLVDDLGDVAEDAAASGGPALNAVLLEARERRLDRAAAADAVRARAARLLGAVATEAAALPDGIARALARPIAALDARLGEG